MLSGHKWMIIYRMSTFMATSYSGEPSLILSEHLHSKEELTYFQWCWPYKTQVSSSHSCNHSDTAINNVGWVTSYAQIMPFGSLAVWGFWPQEYGGVRFPRIWYMICDIKNATSRLRSTRVFQHDWNWIKISRYNLALHFKYPASDAIIVRAVEKYGTPGYWSI